MSDRRLALTGEPRRLSIAGVPMTPYRRFKVYVHAGRQRLQVIGVESFCRRYKVSRATAFKWIREGMPAAHLFGAMCFPVGWCSKWIRENRPPRGNAKP